MAFLQVFGSRQQFPGCVLAFQPLQAFNLQGLKSKKLAMECLWTSIPGTINSY